MSSEVSWKQEHKLIDLEEKPKHYKKTNWLLLSADHGYSSGMKVPLSNCKLFSWLFQSLTGICSSSVEDEVYSVNVLNRT